MYFFCNSAHDLDLHRYGDWDELRSEIKSPGLCSQASGEAQGRLPSASKDGGTWEAQPRLSLTWCPTCPSLGWDTGCWEEAWDSFLVPDDTLLCPATAVREGAVRNNSRGFHQWRVTSRSGYRGTMGWSTRKVTKTQHHLTLLQIAGGHCRNRHFPRGRCHVQDAHGEAALSGHSWMGMKVELQDDQTASAGRCSTASWLRTPHANTPRRWYTSAQTRTIFWQL